MAPVGPPELVPPLSEVKTMIVVAFAEFIEQCEQSARHSDRRNRHRGVGLAHEQRTLLGRHIVPGRTASSRGSVASAG
jgi:hypothetical protein